MTYKRISLLHSQVYRTELKICTQQSSTEEKKVGGNFSWFPMQASLLLPTRLWEKEKPQILALQYCLLTPFTNEIIWTEFTLVFSYLSVDSDSANGRNFKIIAFKKNTQTHTKLMLENFLASSFELVSGQNPLFNPIFGTTDAGYMQQWVN